MTNFPKSILEEKYFRYLFPSLTFLVSIFLWVRADTMFWHPDSMVSASLRLLKSGEFTTYWATYGPASYFAASIGAAFIAALGFVLSAWKSFPEFEDSYRLNSIDVLGKAMTFDHFSLIWNLLLFLLSVYFLYKSLNVIRLNKINYLIALTSMVIFSYTLLSSDYTDS
jgi:hypothetical protein